MDRHPARQSPGAAYMLYTTLAQGTKQAEATQFAFYDLSITAAKQFTGTVGRWHQENNLQYPKQVAAEVKCLKSVIVRVLGGRGDKQVFREGLLYHCVLDRTRR